MSAGQEVWIPSYPTTADTERVLLIKLILAEQGGGGGGGAQDIFVGHYGANVPNFTPTTPTAIAKDLDPPNVEWVWTGTEWI